MHRAGFLACLVVGIGCASEARKPDDRVVVLTATAEVKGTTEPCGCTSDPLGDVARVATLAAGGLWLDAGGLLYDKDGVSAAMRPQADAKAAKLADIYAKAAVGLGADDLALGAGKVRPARLAANVSGVPLAAPRVHLLNGVKVGVFGVAQPARVAPLSATAPDAAAKEAVAKLQKDGAQLIVALLGMSRAEARGLMNAVPGIGFGVIGAEVGEGMPEAEPVGAGFLVAPADQGRRVARIELHVKKSAVALTPFAGEAARQVRLGRVQTKIAALTQQLAMWKGDATADKDFVAARARELAELGDEKKRLETEQPVPPETSYFTYALEPVKRGVQRDGKVAEKLKQLDREIGRTNLAAASALPRPAPEPGVPGYVGGAACTPCHKGAAALWQKTVHATAWKTLVDADKQYNYDCTGCHVTGWQKPGGAHLASVEKAGLVDVQCETCHGPGSKHVAEDGLEEPKTMTRKPADRFCADNCHTKDHSDTFQLEAYLRDILGPGHGEKRRKALGDGPTGKELRAKAIAAAGGK
jgi:hypothetical protein